MQSAIGGAEARGSRWKPWSDRDARVRVLDAQLDGGKNLRKEVEVALRVERAALLTEMGRGQEAQSDHLRVVELEPSHLVNLCGLGKLLASAGRLKAAQMVYAEAVRYYPDDIVSRINLGAVLLEREENALAREQYEAALRIDPEFPQAHGGMYYALARLGEAEAAQVHQRKAFGQKCLFKNPYRGSSTPIPLLLLVSSTGGGTPIEKLLDDCIFETHVLVADFYDQQTPLPPHRLVVNGIGDVEVAEKALDAAEKLLQMTTAPVLNLPAAVRATGRCENAVRLARIPGMVTPATARFDYAMLTGEDGPVALAASGFKFPLLLRTPGCHMGRDFIMAERPEELNAAMAELPGAGKPGAEVLAIEYLDARGADGLSRKYRVMMVGGQLYPLHLAISPQWKIHYFSADMADNADHRAEELRFLTDMPGALGARAMNALAEVQATLGLDYAGIDFGLNHDGEILLFEANSTMVVEQPVADERWDYRRAAVERIHTAVRKMLLSSAVPPG